MSDHGGGKSHARSLLEGARSRRRQACHDRRSPWRRTARQPRDCALRIVMDLVEREVALTVVHKKLRRCSAGEGTLTVMA